MLEAQLGPLSRASLVYAPAPGGGPANVAVQWHGNHAGIDTSLVAGRLRSLRLFGMDLAGQPSAAGCSGRTMRSRTG